jgi:pilus assembly protein CpaB
MRRRVIGIFVAVLLAGFGTLALVAYVQSAKDDAQAEEPLREVYVVTQDVPQGALFREIVDSVELTEVPERLAASDAVTDLEDVGDDMVSAVDLKAGEQLLAGRLVDPESLVRVQVPDGLQELTLSLDPERAVGGVLHAGDLVGVVLSFDPFEITDSGVPAAPDDDAGGGGDEPDADADAGDSTQRPTKTPNMTHLTLHKVQVTSVRYAQRDSERIVERRQDDDTDVNAIGSDDDEQDEVAPTAVVDEGPEERLLVTIAVTSPEVEQIVFAAEFGHVWLTKQTTDTDEDGTRIVTLDQVYVVVPRT